MKTAEQKVKQQMIMIRPLPITDLHRIGEIDRSERITLFYRCTDGKLETESVDWDVPAWNAGDGEHSVGHLVHQCRAVLEAGGVLLGAFDGDTLAGIGILRYRLTETMAQLALLHVSRAYRRQGVARKLTREMIRLAQEDGATEMYVSATPSGSAVGFYSSQGFQVAPPERIHPELYQLEPEDIHMIKSL